MTALDPAPAEDVTRAVRQALAEDLGGGDLTAALVPEHGTSRARIVSREAVVLCGSAWVDEVFRQIDPAVEVEWHCRDGDRLAPARAVCEIAGPSRPILSGERTALNFLQLLSGTATSTRAYVDAVAGTGARVLDTRKTIPGLRLAQKYAVRCGGGSNHRIGLFDAVLIKENHIAAAGGIAAAVSVATARARGVLIEVEVETLSQLEEALTAGIDRVLLDNFGLEELGRAVEQRNASGRNVELEASGGITLDNIRQIALTGVDLISVGAITKDVDAADYSMRFD